MFVEGDTVMHLSARSQFPQQFIEVVQHGGDVNLRGRHGDMVIHELIKGGVPNPKARIEAAVKHGADINAFNASGDTPIILACGWGSQFDVAIFLLSLGADPEIREQNGMMTAVHSVLAFKRNVKKGTKIATLDSQAFAEQFLQLLKERGCDLDEAQADLDRWSRFAKKRPDNPSWYHKDEIQRLKRRDQERMKKANAPVADEPPPQPH